MNPSSTAHVKQRRRQLRQQRRVNAAKALWRFGCMSGILAGVGWIATQPDWMISKPEQIRIQGHRYLSDAAIRSMLAIRYPQPIVQLSPQQLTSQLLKHSSIASVTIDRGLLPPRLLVQIEDRPPVAQILRNESKSPPAFLDERGTQMPISSYQAKIQQSPPRLRAILPTQGMCPNWQQLYQAVNGSPVLIGIINCQNPQNLILQTEVGAVRLGSFGDRQRLINQIEQLDLLRDWRKYTDRLEEVDYLDLENPQAPKFQLKQPGTIPPQSS